MVLGVRVWSMLVLGAIEFLYLLGIELERLVIRWEVQAQYLSVCVLIVQWGQVL
jgi:hypothetical protein